VYVDFGRPHARALGDIKLDELKNLHAEGHFPAGSMGAKIRAAIEFLEAGGKSVVITRPGDLQGAVEGVKGTTIHM